MKEGVENWLDSARYDLETAEAMFNSARYVYTVFMCHLAMEKALKARVQQLTGKTPPRTHSLRYLLSLSGLEPPEHIFAFLSKLSDISIPTRYPQDFAALLRTYDREAANTYLSNAREALKWIEESLLS